MAYDETLACRVREALAARLGVGDLDDPDAQVVVKPMFGGLGFMVNTHMAVGLHSGGGLIVPLGFDDGVVAAAREHGGEPMSMGAKAMSGWWLVPDAVVVGSGGDSDDDAEAALAWWIDAGVTNALAKPPKKPKTPKVKPVTSKPK